MRWTRIPYKTKYKTAHRSGWCAGQNMASTGHVTAAANQRLVQPCSLRWPNSSYIRLWVAAQHFPAWNDVMAAVLKLWHLTRHLTPSIDAYWLEEQFCQISSRSHLKRRKISLFWRGRPNKKNKNNQMRMDMRSVPDQNLSASPMWPIPSVVSASDMEMCTC